MSSTTSDCDSCGVPPVLDPPAAPDGRSPGEGRPAGGRPRSTGNGIPRKPFRKPSLVWWVSLICGCVVSSACIHWAWGPVPWQVPMADARRLDTVVRELESGRITPGMRISDANLPKPVACEICYSDAALAEGDVAYGAWMYYSGKEWVTVYYGGRDGRIFAVVHGGRGTVNGERWHFCDFEMLRTYIEANMRQWRDDLQAGSE